MPSDLLTHMNITIRKAQILGLEAEVLELWLNSYAEHRQKTGSLRKATPHEYAIGMNQRIVYCENKCKQYMESQI